jgi:hypothetical protein
MIEPGSVLVKAGISASGPLIGLVMRQLEDGEREQIGRGLKSGLTRLGRKTKGVWPKTGKRKGEAAREQRSRRAIAQGAAEWSGFLATQVVRLWREKPKLARVVAQLNAESGMGPQQALLLASREISRNLRWIAFSATALALLGGGITLLVLFLDKG